MAKKQVTIEGLQELQDYNIRAIASLEPTGNVNKAIKLGTTMAHRYAVAITHVITRALAASHVMTIGGLQGVVNIRGGALNPRTHTPTSEYGPIEHARGGSHAFYKRTVDEQGNEILQKVANQIQRGLS